MSDPRRKAPKAVRWGDPHSGSSRASTVGGSSTSSGHSGSQYTAEYNVGALEESLRSTVRELDHWKKKAEEAEDERKKSENLFNARIKALEHSEKTLTQHTSDLEKELRDLKREFDTAMKDNSKLQKKLEKYESQSEPSSPDSAKPRRSDSKRSKESETDKHNDRLKERFNRASEAAGETTSSRPPPSSSSRSKHSSGRRVSVSSERPPHLEGWGPGGASATPTSSTTSSSKRLPPDYIVPNMPVATSSMPPPVFSSTSRSTVVPSMRPTVEYTTYGQPYETGNYQFHPLPRR